MQSINLAVRTELLETPPAPVEGPAGDDELRILLSFRLATPLDYYIDSPARPKSPRPATSPRGGLLAPPATPRRISRSASVSFLDLLRRVKDGAKWNHENPKGAPPPEISKVVYNLAIAIALNECGETITDLPHDKLDRNLRWALGRPWIDSRLPPVFERGRERLRARRGAVNGGSG